MRKAKKIGVIGRISEQLCDGQTVKTRVLVQELKACYPDHEIIMAETYNYKRHPARLLGQIIRCMAESEAVFMLLADNGIRVIFPIVHFLNHFCHTPLLHDGIGGSLDELVMRHPGLKKYMNGFRINWVETAQLKSRLEAIGIQNVEVLPNFKRLATVHPQDLRIQQNEPFRFCTFSRVRKDKGVLDAAQAVLELNRSYGRKAAALDVYGPVEEEDCWEQLEHMIQTSDGAIRYQGVANYNESVQILQDYFMLLFPTRYWGEGFPGTLIDALSSGLPVIATNWHCNHEIIEHGTTGYLYEPDEPERLKELMDFSVQHPKMIGKMRANCLKEAQKYSADNVMKIVCEKISEVTEK